MAKRNKLHQMLSNQVLKASCLLSGFVGSNYISFDEAQDLLYDLIESNDYLSKDINNYKTTAKTMLLKCLGSPVLLPRHQND